MEQLLTTKLYIPPTRPELVSRPRLIEQLNEGLQSGRKLTLISAPAGFGKTTLTSEWVSNLGSDAGQESQTEYRIAWLSVDESDNAPERFLAYLIAAFNQDEGIETMIGKAALGMLQAPQSPPVEAILTSLINDITILPDHIILVIDDYHLIDSRPVDNSLTFLIEHQPSQLHLVIATREDPHLSLARLRVRGQLTELRAMDLRFTSSEAAEFLNKVMGLNLSTQDIAALETRTEGWIAGLQLAAISIQGHTDTSSLIKSFTGSHRFVLDYLIEEVLEQQSEGVQTFLLQTAILDRLNGSLCDAVRFGNTVTKQDNGQEILEELEHHNLFIVPLDGERHWYRYHHLFLDLLRQRLRKTHLELIPTLHLRASEWFEVNGITDEAIEHAIGAENYERAVQLIESIAESLWVRGEDTKLRRWLNVLPAELVCSKPELCVLNAWNLIASGKLDAAERGLEDAELVIKSNSDDVIDTTPQEQEQQYSLNQPTLLGKVATTRAFAAFYRGDVPRIIEYAHLALEYLPEQNLSWRSTATNILGDGYNFKGEMAEAYRVRLEAMEASTVTGNSYQMMISTLKLAITLRYQGQLQQVIDICQQQKRFADESGMAHTDVGGWLLAIWGEVLVEMNDLEGALAKTKRGVEIGERGGDLAMLGWSYLCLIRTLFTLGDLATAEEVAHKIEAIARESYVPPWIMKLQAAWKARIWLAQDMLETTSQWVEERGLDANSHPAYGQEFEYLMLARILIAQRRLDEAITLLQRMFESAENGERTSRAIKSLILQALAFQNKGDTTQAMTQLEQALARAEPRGFMRTFIDEGPPMAHLLYDALTRGIAPEYVHRLLGAFPDIEAQSTQPPEIRASHPTLIEPLSEREIEILQLISKGFTNPEIAARLYLSLNTIKVHTRNIYGKLDVHNRTQAIARAQALGLLTQKPV